MESNKFLLKKKAATACSFKRIKRNEESKLTHQITICQLLVFLNHMYIVYWNIADCINISLLKNIQMVSVVSNLHIWCNQKRRTCDPACHTEGNYFSACLSFKLGWSTLKNIQIRHLHWFIFRIITDQNYPKLINLCQKVSLFRCSMFIRNWLNNTCDLWPSRV